VLVSPRVVPGLTTVSRVHGATDGGEPEARPVDLYLGVDCSGSMQNPRCSLSFPVLAGAVVLLSAIRAGARVLVVLSGEPGRSVATPGFVRDARLALGVLTGYLGSGYAFGIHRLADTFAARKASERPVHILVVSDHDMFSMLDSRPGETPYGRTRGKPAPPATGAIGWDVAREAAARARGGATYVLRMPAIMNPEGVARMKADGWGVHSVERWDDIVAFARAWSRAAYERKGATRRGR
jgi:hypothetical protein